MRHEKTIFIIILTLIAVGMVGLLMVLAASAAPAAPLSPSHQLSQADIQVTDDSVTIAIENARWVRVAGTRSMEPVLREGAQVLERVPATATELQVGDIITYQSSVHGKPIIHRIVEISTDAYGWYAITKGDNADAADAERVRFPQVKGVAVAILY